MNIPDQSAVRAKDSWTASNIWQNSHPQWDRHFDADDVYVMWCRDRGEWVKGLYQKENSKIYVSANEYLRFNLQYPQLAIYQFVYMWVFLIIFRPELFLRSCPKNSTIYCVLMDTRKSPKIKRQQLQIKYCFTSFRFLFGIEIYLTP